jgi:hypothetical protein
MLKWTSLSCTILAVALIGSAGNAQVACLSEKGAGYPWAWREIDGKRCWYKGKSGMDKKLLRWEAAKSPAASKRTPSVIIKDSAERDRLLHSYWPPLPPDFFENRLGGERGSNP